MELDRILLGDNMDLLPALPNGAFQLIYIDPPFNTGRRQERRTLATVAAWCAAHDVLPESLSLGQRNLEDVFLELTGRESLS